MHSTAAHVQRLIRDKFQKSDSPLQEPLHKAGADVTEVECMKAEVTSQFAAGKNTAHAVSLRIQLGRVNANTELTIHHTKNAA